jgi:hypothetical protein
MILLQFREIAELKTTHIGKQSEVTVAQPTSSAGQAHIIDTQGGDTQKPVVSLDQP